MTHPTKVFISYSHDSPEHSEFVLQLSERLRQDGLDSQIDRYCNGTPAEGWQRWMEQQLENADYVLLVCTPLYLKRFKGKDTEAGRGVNFEGIIISQTLYDNHYRNTKFLPVIPVNGSIGDVPRALKDFSYLLFDQYEKLYRVLTDQHATPASPIGDVRNLAEIEYPDATIPAASPMTPRRPAEMATTKASEIGPIVTYNEDNRDFLWLPFSIEQQNNTLQAEYLGENSVTRPLPLELSNSQQVDNNQLFQLLFGDADHCLDFLQQFPHTAQIQQPEDAKIRIRLMIDDPQLAMLPWQQMLCPKTGKRLIELGWMIEISPPVRYYQDNFSPLNIHTPLIVIPTDKSNNMSASQHYSLVHDYLNSYLDISGFIPRISTADQLQREINHQQPDLIYFYCPIQQDKLQLDNSRVSLQQLAEMIEQADLPSSPILILNLTGTSDDCYSLPLLKQTRLIWLQINRSQLTAHSRYEKSLFNVLEKLRHNNDLAAVISHENLTQKQAYLWLTKQTPKLNIEQDSSHQKQQLRAALLRVMLGRKALKESMSYEIASTEHRHQGQVLIYAICGDEKACPFEFPAQIRQTLQWDDPERKLNVIPFEFPVTINPSQDPYQAIENDFSYGLLQGSSKIEEFFFNEKARRGLDQLDCCIMINWLITVPQQNIDNIDTLIKKWIGAWCEIINELVVGNLPTQTVLVSAACLQVNREDQAQKIHDIANKSIRDIDYPALQLIPVEKALGKLNNTEIGDFLRNKKRWRRDLKLDDYHIKPYDYADWIIENTQGVFDATVQLIWQQYQTNYTDNPLKDTNLS